MRGLSNEPPDTTTVDYSGLDTLLATVMANAPGCYERLKAIVAKVKAEGILSISAEDTAFVGQMTKGDYSGCVVATSSGFSLSDVPWWGWLLALAAANELGVFGKNDLQVLDL